MNRFFVLSAVTLAGISPLAHAQDALFAELSIPASSASVGQFAAGDVDGDGDLDFVAAALVAIGNDNILVMTQGSGGNFTTTSAFNTGVNVRDVQLVDMNGDGVLDVVFAGDGALVESVSVALGNGDATFGPTTSFAVWADPADHALDDINGDGALDGATPSATGGRITVRLGNGDGTFQARTDYVVGDSPAAIATGDVNGDSNVDLVVANEGSNSLSILIGDGNGSFTAAAPVALSTPPSDVGLGDFDGNGTLDLAVGSVSPNTSITLLGNGDGTFGAALSVDLGDFARAVTVVDVDEDGLDDVATLIGLGDIGVRRSSGAGTFENPARLSAPGLTTDLAVADMTGDGDLDLVVIGELVFGFGSAVAVLEGNGRGAFRASYSGDDGCSDVGFGDLDGDGIPDMVLVNEFSDNLSVFPGVGNGFFDAAFVIAVNDRPSSLALDDLNGDGDLDLVLSQPNASGTVDILFGDGAFGFSAPTLLTPLGSPWTTITTDVENDGDADIVAVSLGSSTLNVFLNDGSGAFTGPTVLATSTNPFDLVAGDMNGDGFDDIVVCTTQSARADVFLNEGDGTFASVAAYSAGARGSAIDVGDLDEDGDLDVVISNDVGASSVTVLLNNGDGTLAAPINLASGGNSSSGVAAADFDDDGHLDIAVAHGSSLTNPVIDAVTVLLGAGDATFAAPDEYYITSFPRRLTRFDVNGDGVADLAAPGFGDSVDILISQHGPWTNLGFALAGEQGLPKQVGEGTLIGGDTFIFTLSDARKDAFASHIVGFSQVNAPFKGGVFVPAPFLINAGIPTDATGDLVLTGPWPTGASGIVLFLQFVIADPAAVKNFALSNAVRAEIP